MKEFFKYAFASCLGVFLAGLFLTLVFGVGVSSMVSGLKKSKTIKSNSVLRLNLTDLIPEKTNNVANQQFSLEDKKVLGVHEIVDAIEYAKDDKSIKGILLDLSMVQAGSVTRSELRDALLDFRESDKFVYAYSKNYMQGAYHLASAADKVYVNPLGSLEFKGYAANVSFYKKMLDKIGVKMQVYYAGDFKGGSEPYRLEKLSKNNRQQIREYISGLWDELLNDVSESRGVEKAELKRIADELLVRSPEDAVTHGLADEVAYFDQVITAMKGNIGLEEDDKLNVASLSDYAAKATKKLDLKIKDRVAVVYAEGTILPGQAEPGSIGDDKYTKIIRKLRKDDRVKAIVLRVNSGGGSALASENIWRELLLAKEKGIPVIASMGDVAASGGYYISCHADTIVAESSTITGSIGVYSMIPNAKEMFEEKLGISTDTVFTGPMANGVLGNFMEPHNAKQASIMTDQTEKMYEIFLQRVADGRGMSRDAVHEIAQGRVWTGVKAKEIGLVDVIGDLDKAIEIAANSAGLEKYRSKEYPFIKDPLEQMMDKLTGQENSDQAVEMLMNNHKGLNKYYPVYRTLKDLENMEGVQMRLPFEIDVY